MNKRETIASDFKAALRGAEAIDRFLKDGEGEGNTVEERIRELNEEQGLGAVIAYVDRLLNSIYVMNRAGVLASLRDIEEAVHD